MYFLWSKYQIVNSRCSRGRPSMVSSSAGIERWRAGVGAPLGVQRFQHRQPEDVLDGKVVLRLPARGDQAPPILPVQLIRDVVLGPPLRIAQDRVRVVELAEARLVARDLVVGMIALRQEAVGAADRLRLGVRAELEQFVIVNRCVVCHEQESLAVLLVYLKPICPAVYSSRSDTTGSTRVARSAGR